MIPLLIYQNEIIDFLRTCTIKNTYFEKQSADDVAIVLNRPTIELWENPYFLHMNGLYSKYDTPMYVQSIDTKTQILFDRAILKKHPRTRASYEVPNDKFKDLCNQYPTQTELIKSILYPARTLADDEIAQHTNAVINILSLDEFDLGQTITLSRFDLATHPKTLATYQEKNSEYLTIVGMNQPYVDAVLFPIQSNDNIVTCKNMTLVAYDEDMLHPNERADILQHMTNWLYMLDHRWDVRDFDYEEYYYPTWWSYVWYLLPNVLLSRRYQNIQTNKVHPFHIWEYLKSHGLQDYRDILNNTQELFLYKNIRYLKQNGGKQSNLKILSDNLLSDFGVELRAKGVLNKINEENPNPNAPLASIENCELTPLIISESLDDSISLLQNSEDGTESIHTIVEREHGDDLEPYDNDDEYQELVVDQTKRLQNSKYTYLPTKLIELREIDRDESYLDLYYNFILHTTMMKFKNGELPIELSLQLEDGGYSYRYNIGELLALLYYCAAKAKSFDIVDINKPMADGDGDWEVTGINPEGVSYDGDGNRVIATYNDNSKHQATEGVTIIPNKIECVSAYKPTFDTRPTYFVGSSLPSQRVMRYSIESFLDVDKIYDSVPNRQLIDDSPDNLMLDLNEQFASLVKHFNIMRSISDYATSRAWSTVYDYMIYVGGLDFNFVPGFTEYADWIDSIPTLRNFLTKIEFADDRKQQYEALSMRLIKAIFPSDRASGMFATGLTDTEYVRMKALFMQLCSYNIAFIDTDRVSNIYFMTAVKTIANGGREEGRDIFFDFPWWEMQIDTQSHYKVEFNDYGQNELNIIDNKYHEVNLQYEIDKKVVGNKHYELGVDYIVDRGIITSNSMKAEVSTLPQNFVEKYPLQFYTKNDGVSVFDIELLVNNSDLINIWKLPDGSDVITNHIEYSGFTTNDVKQVGVHLINASNVVSLTANDNQLLNTLELRMLSNLRYVDLSNNSLQFIKIAGLEELVSINISNNNINTLLLNRHPKLNFIDVTNCSISTDTLEEIVSRLHQEKDNLGDNTCVIKLENNNIPNANTLIQISELIAAGCVVTHD